MFCAHCLREVPVNPFYACVDCQARVDEAIAEELGWEPDWSKSWVSRGIRVIPGKE